MTLAELYQHAKEMERPVTPATAFVREIADLTKKSEIAVRRWLSGDSEPDALTQEVIAKHFNSTPQQLFPKHQ